MIVWMDVHTSLCYRVLECYNRSILVSDPACDKDQVKIAVLSISFYVCVKWNYRLLVEKGFKWHVIFRSYLLICSIPEQATV